MRIVPPLPWQFDFNKGENLPITWIGGRVRYVLEEIDGEQAAVQARRAAHAARPEQQARHAQRHVHGPGRPANYTIQADVRLTEKDGRLPDVVGLINSGYTLGIRPGDKQLSIYSWASHDYRTSAGSTSSRSRACGTG